MIAFSVASTDSVILYFGDEIGENVAKEVREAFYAFKNADLKEVIEIIPSYTSIMISYDFLSISYDDICKKLKDILNQKKSTQDEIITRDMTIPVCYDEEVGLDLASLAKGKDMSIEDVISLHVDKVYFVYAIGFLPGFPYMGEVDKRIATPRLANPRAKVPKGSVGIADIQTAIYPQVSPGGWQIIGRTPIEMFDTSYDGFSYLKVGDRVKFEPINKDKFLELGGSYE